VAVTGEVYFEVNAVGSPGSKKKPFIVDISTSARRTGGGRIEVLGTIFNVNAYEDENVIKTTLLKGKVKIASLPAGASATSSLAIAGNYKLLLPGQQAQLPNATSGHNDSIKIIDGIDADMEVAWKNGLHSFKNADVKSIMRMLTRWYNVEIVYEGNIPDYKFTGSIPRSENMSSVLSMLQYAGMHFKLRDGKVVVIP
jgi:ferric-dicitrate binding protein FerR (iron transport regulator)